MGIEAPLQTVSETLSVTSKEVCFDPNTTDTKSIFVTKKSLFRIELEANADDDEKQAHGRLQV